MSSDTNFAWRFKGKPFKLMSHKQHLFYSLWLIFMLRQKKNRPEYDMYVYAQFENMFMRSETDCGKLFSNVSAKISFPR